MLRPDNRQDVKRKIWLRATVFRGGAVLLGLIGAFAVFEIGLRIHNPFYTTIQGDRIVLRANCEFDYQGQPEYGTDEHVVYRTNSLGFRGPELTTKHRLTVITVGGSTTASITLNEDSTWSGQLSHLIQEVEPDSWLNNAGFVGHTTFAHMQLVPEYVLPLKPDFILMLAGVNDVGREYPSNRERNNLRDLDLTSAKEFFRSLSCYSEVVALGINLVRWKRAHDRGLPYRGTHIGDFEHMEIEPKAAVQELLERHRDKYIPGYRQRVQAIARACQENNTQLVLITQPALFGGGVDDVSGVSLETMKVTVSTTVALSGSTQWKTLELYNDVLRDVGQANGLLVVDLAREMLKSSPFFYDSIHFTREGSRRVAEIIWQHFEPVVREHQESEPMR